MSGDQPTPLDADAPTLGDRRLVAVNAGWLVSDRVLKLGINFLVGILIARHLGPAGYGLLSFGQMLITFALPLATFGLSDLLLREFARSDRDATVILASALRIRLATAFASLVCVMVAAWALRGSDSVVLLVVLAYALSFFPQAFDTIETRFQSLDRVGLISTIRMIATLIFGGLRVGAIVLGMDVITFAALYTLEIVFIAAGSYLQARRHGIAIKPGLRDLEESRYLLRMSLPLMARLFAIGLYMRIDQLVISILLGDRMLGIYSVATRITELWYFVPTSLVIAAMPSLTRKYEESPEAYERALARLMRLMVMIGVPAALVISLTSGLIVDTLFGEAYRQAAPVLAIQAWAGVFVAIGVGANPWFINTGHMRYGLYQAVAGAIVGLSLNLLLIPTYGLIGASIAMVVGFAVSAVLMNAVFARTRPLFLLQLRAFVLR